MPSTQRHLLAALTLILSIRQVSGDIIFTSERCDRLNFGLQIVAGDPARYKQCGPSGRVWIVPCSPSMTFDPLEKVCKERPSIDRSSAATFSPLRRMETSRGSSPRVQTAVTDIPMAPPPAAEPEEFVFSTVRPKRPRIRTKGNRGKIRKTSTPSPSTISISSLMMSSSTAPPSTIGQRTTQYIPPTAMNQWHTSTTTPEVSTEPNQPAFTPPHKRVRTSTQSPLAALQSTPYENRQTSSYPRSFSTPSPMNPWIGQSTLNIRPLSTKTQTTRTTQTTNRMTTAKPTTMVYEEESTIRPEYTVKYNGESMTETEFLQRLMSMVKEQKEANEQRKREEEEMQRAETEREERARVEAERAEKEREEKERLETQKKMELEMARLTAERMEKARLELEKQKKREQEERHRQAEEAKKRREQAERERAEKQRQEKIRMEKMKKDAEERMRKEEVERAEFEKQRQYKLERQRRLEAEKQRKLEEEAERQRQIEMARERELEAEKQRLREVERQRELAEKQRVEAELMEKERREMEEQQRREMERLENQRREEERAETQRREMEKLEKQRIEMEQLLERERQSFNRLGAESTTTTQMPHVVPMFPKTKLPDNTNIIRFPPGPDPSRHDFTAAPPATAPSDGWVTSENSWRPNPEWTNGQEEEETAPVTSEPKVYRGCNINGDCPLSYDEDRFCEHPNNPSAYLQCAPMYGRRGRWTERFCPDTLIFIQELARCEKSYAPSQSLPTTYNPDRRVVIPRLPTETNIVEWQGNRVVDGVPPRVMTSPSFLAPPPTPPPADYYPRQPAIFNTIDSFPRDLLPNMNAGAGNGGNGEYQTVKPIIEQGYQQQNQEFDTDEVDLSMIHPLFPRVQPSFLTNFLPFKPMRDGEWRRPGESVIGAVMKPVIKKIAMDQTENFLDRLLADERPDGETRDRVRMEGAEKERTPRDQEKTRELEKERTPRDHEKSRESETQIKIADRVTSTQTPAITESLNS